MVSNILIIGEKKMDIQCPAEVMPTRVWLVG